MTKKKKNNTSQVDGLEFDIVEVEKLMGYSFKNVKLLREALTHSSFTNSPNSSSTTESASFKRLAFLGDAALNQVFTEYLFRSYPYLDPGSLTDLRKANVCTDKMARVAVRHNLHLYLLRRNLSVHDDEVRKYTESSRTDETVVNAKPPKVLADIVESIAAAVYIDSGFDLELLWEVFKGLFEPIVLPDTIELKHEEKGAKHIIDTYMGGTHCGTGSSEYKEMAKQTAALSSFKKCVVQALNLERKRQECHGKIYQVVEKVEESKHELNVAMALSEKLRVHVSVLEAKIHASIVDCRQVVDKEEESKQNLNASMDSSKKLWASLFEPDAKRHESPAECCQIENEDESKKKLNDCSWMGLFFSCFIIYFLFSNISMVESVG